MRRKSAWIAHGRILKTGSLLRVGVCALAAQIFLTEPCIVRAQEVRRALPVDEPPTAPPIAPFFNEPARPVATPIPVQTPPPAQPPPRPRPAVTPPIVSDESGARAVSTPSAAAVSAPSPDQIQLEFANGFYARGLFDLAAPEYEKYLGMFANAPERQSALFFLGECYRKLGNTTAAKNAYQTLVSSFITGDYVGAGAYRLADIFWAEKNYSSALPFYRKASVRVKDPAVALAAKYYSARCLENLKTPNEARLIYEDIASTKGDNPYREASRLALAQILTNLGKKDDALRQFDALVQETQKPEVKAEALVKSALLRISLGQADRGAADLNKALKMPEIGQLKPAAQIGLLRVLYENGKYKQLLDTYENALKDLPPEAKPEVLLLAANSNRQLNNHKAASEVYEQIVREYPDSPYEKEARYERLVSLYNSDDPALPKAADDYLASNPDAEKREQVTLMKAEMLFKQQKYSEAAPIYASLNDSMELPMNLKSEAEFKLGWCYAQTKDPEKAIKVFTDFLSENPNHKLTTSALAQRAMAYQQTKNLAAALKDFSQLIDRYPKAKERELALQQKALILGQRQDNAGMADTFKLLLKEFPNTSAAAQANYWIGWAAFEAKNYKAAISPLEAARKLDKEQFFERATMKLMVAHYYLEERDPLAAEVDAYTKGEPKGKVPAEVQRWLALAFLTGKNYESAEKYLAPLVKREDDANVDDWLNLGRAQIGEKKYQEAVTSLGAFLNGMTQPVPRATGLLALCQAQMGLEQYTDAQKSADEACSLQPEGKLNAEGRMLSGDIQFAQSKYDEAAKIYQSISVIVDDDPQITPLALEKAYQSLMKNGSEPEAAKILNTLQTRYPEYQMGRKQP